MTAIHGVPVTFLFWRRVWQLATVNVGFIDLGRLERDGFYANRADFIRTAVRSALERQDEAVPNPQRANSLA